MRLIRGRAPLSEVSRYAIYFAPPPDSPLHLFGSAWLGRDALSGAEMGAPALDGLSPERWRRVTSAPKLYGFHATLKAPFRLSAGSTREDLSAAVARFAAARQPFDGPPLRVARIANFIALVPRRDSPALEKFAAACVRTFERFRAPLTPADRARREDATLTPRQRELLTAWGYPYVFDQWRFHMTLASGLDRGDADELCQMLDGLTAPYCDAPTPVNAVCLFEQPEPDAPFRVIGRFLFGAAADV